MKMNSNLLNKVFMFAAGAAVGSTITWKLVKTKYEQIARDEIESVREVFARNTQTPEQETKATVEENDDDEEDEVKPTVSEKSVYQKVVRGLGYSNEDEEESDMGRPYVISPDEFGEQGYAEISLTYYEDGVVTNDRGKIIGNVDELIGADFASHYGEYEDDSVFVRNDDLRIDYEILKVYEKYSERE